MAHVTLHETRWTSASLRPLLDRAAKLRIGVVGDFCLDVYWMLAPQPGPPSAETGKPTRRVAKSLRSPGGAGAVAMNALAMGAQVEAFGAVGSDPYGTLLRTLLKEGGANVEAVATEADFATPVYVKPVAGDEEQERFDLGMQSRISDAGAESLAARLAVRLGELDAVIVTEQLGGVFFTPTALAALQKALAQAGRKTVVVDSRTFAAQWKNAVLRLNATDAARALGDEAPLDGGVSLDLAERAARSLAQSCGRAAIVSRGERGAIVADGANLVHIPAIQALGKVDPVGAGDAMTAAVAVALALGSPAENAAALGALAASIVCGKRKQTGTASAAELLAVADESDYVFWPDLADNPRAARFLPGTQIEAVSGAEPPKKVTHAIFDHDGTISTLRQGWEAIMEPMMIKAILGHRFSDIDAATYDRIAARSRDFIDKTTGIQTLIQMQGLAALVREYGYVPAENVLDEHGYKKIYNDELIKMVEERVARLNKGELNPHDYAMKGAIELLHALKQAGVVLYLASGTDEPDVKAEAAAMGYAELFDGHIYGSTGDVTKDAKKMVLERILGEIGADAMGGLIMVGDGPVEIRETEKRGGFTIGLASDEVRRHGWNMSKRGRLVKAGCDWLMADFSQLGKLLELLNIR